MQVSPARKTAFEILLRVDAGRGFAAELLQEPRVSSLSEVDRRLATEIVMGVLRWRGELDYRLEQASGKPVSSLDAEVAMAMRVGLYQIMFLERIPSSAAVNESVELTKRARKGSAAGLVNAVLRKSSARRLRTGKLVGEQDAEAIESARRSMPPWLLTRWEENYGVPAASSLARISTEAPQVTLRVPAHLGDVGEIARKLENHGVKTRPGRYAPRALVVEANEQATSTVADALGLLIQDEASQLVTELLGARPGQRVLDLCAAPGVKTARLADALKPGILVACDISRRRLRAMARFLPRMTVRADAIALVRLDASRPLPFRTPFDRILLDAPCSGTGTLARHPEIKWRLMPQDLDRLSEVQSRLLRNALERLAPGGRLVYATCSVEPEENERVVEAALSVVQRCHLVGRQELSEEFPKLAPLFDARGFLRTRPDVHGLDGFFAAVAVR